MKNSYVNSDNNPVQSTHNLVLLLEDSIEKNKTIDLKLASACKTQGTLAHFSSKEKNIIPMSINSLKKYADIAIENGGWEYLDNLRTQIKKITKHIDSSPKKKKTRTKLQAEKISSLKLKLDRERRERLILLRAYDELFKILKKQANHDIDAKNKYSRHLAKFSIESGIKNIK